jgi:protein-S-isoprenylcysteine O-methyltransferase Ste14
MPLSEHEQRLLEQIERALYAEDPKFASTVRGGRIRRPTRRRRAQGIALFVVGLVLLVTGIVLTSLTVGATMYLFISAGGFLLMLGGAVLAVGSMRAGGAAPEATAQAEPEKGGFTGRMEERFRRRFEQD